MLSARLSASLTRPFSSNVLNRRDPQGGRRLAAHSSPGDEKGEHARAHGAAREAQGRQQVCATGLASSRQRCTVQGDATLLLHTPCSKGAPSPSPTPSGSDDSLLTVCGWPGGARRRRTQQRRRLRSCGASTGLAPIRFRPQTVFPRGGGARRRVCFELVSRGNVVCAMRARMIVSDEESGCQAQAGFR